MPANIGGKTYSNGQLIIGGGIIVAFINWFIPWWWAESSSYSGPSYAGLGSDLNQSSGIGGLGYWAGWLGFLVLLCLIALFVLRNFVPNVLPALPVADWMIYGVGGVFMLLMVVLFLTYAGGAGGSYSGAGYSFSSGISIGFFIGLIATAAVAVGGWLSKSDPQPATAPMNFSGFNQTPPAPPAPPAQ
jgi:amino acid transporter